MTQALQESLKFSAAYLAAHEVERLRELIREVCDRYGRKNVCHELDYNRSSLDNMLAGRERCPPRPELIIFAILVDEERRIIDYLCQLSSGAFTPHGLLTPEQKLDRALRAARRYVSAEVAEQIEREASGLGTGGKG